MGRKPRPSSGANSRPSARDSCAPSTHSGSQPTKTVQAQLLVTVLAAFALGFVLSGGIGATMRLLFRRSREGGTQARVGPIAVIKRR
jgi:hypothetical protein